jgi:hypothetical protein
MERPPSLNDFLEGHPATPETVHEWEILLLAYQHYVKREPIDEHQTAA